MRLSGRTLLILAIVVVAALFSLILLGGRESPESVAIQFMTALSKGDSDKLAALSSTRNSSAETIKKQWEFATHVAAPHYTFLWRIMRSLQASPNEASVSLQVTRNALTPGSFEENYELPLVREQGKWKVVVSGINAEMYPALPR